MKMTKLISTSFLALAVAVSAAHALVVTYSINANGAKEVSAAGVPNQGDADGTAVGTLALDNVAGSATFSVVVSNLDGTFTGFHVHQAPATTTGPIVLNFGTPTSFLTGTPTAGIVAGTVTGLSTSVIDAVFANPSGFYFNMHTTIFPAGAVRDQLSAPTVGDGGMTAAMLFAMLGGLIALRRRLA